MCICDLEGNFRIGLLVKAIYTSMLWPDYRQSLLFTTKIPHDSFSFFYWRGFKRENPYTWITNYSKINSHMKKISCDSLSFNDHIRYLNKPLVRWTRGIWKHWLLLGVHPFHFLLFSLLHAHTHTHVNQTTAWTMFYKESLFRGSITCMCCPPVFSEDKPIGQYQKCLR